MKPPEDTPLLYPKSFSLVVFGASAATLIHITFLWVFLTYDLLPLFYFNFVSVSLFVVLLLIAIRKGQTNKTLATLMIIGSIEVIAHQVFAVLLLGWNYGFQYYLITIPCFVLLGDFKKQTIPITFSAISFVVLLFLYFYCRIYPPTFQLGETIRDNLYTFNLVNFVLLVMLFGGLFAHISRKYEKKLLETQEQLYVAATTDSMTNLSNRRKTVDLLEHEILKKKRSGKHFMLAIGDIDNFKSINDNYGHDTGDAVIIAIAKIMRSMSREIDIVGRWGGEEFLIALPETDLTEGKLVIERMMHTISNTPVIANDALIDVTMTFGVTSSNYANAIEGIIKLADQALYKGKHGSKNCIVLSHAGGDNQTGTSNQDSNIPAIKTLHASSA